MADNELKKQVRKKLEKLNEFIEDDLNIEINKFRFDIVVETKKGKHKDKKSAIVSLNFIGTIDVTEPFNDKTDAILSSNADELPAPKLLEENKYQDLEGD